MVKSTVADPQVGFARRIRLPLEGAEVASNTERLGANPVIHWRWAEEMRSQPSVLTP